MTKPTNDERLVAARRIRAIMRKDIFDDSHLVAALKGAIGTDRVRTPWPTHDMLAMEDAAFLRRLADLIEPDLIEPERRTCRNLQYLWYDFTCSECGFQLEYTDRECEYCPICGAKVIEGEK